jgi:hypothetical protein
MTKVLFKFLFLSLIPVIFFSSCRKENLKPGIPAWITVDTIAFQTVYVDQGTAMQKITDVWVFVNDQSIGAFQLPATIPILKEGTGELRLEAGIMLNGISTTRLPNMFFKPVIYEDFNFVPDSTVLVSPETEYWETVHFVWKEDFDAMSVSIDTTAKSKTNIVLTEPGSDETFQGEHSGKIVLDSVHNFYEGASFTAFQLPTNGKPVFLEMNYKCNNMLVVGIFAQNTSQIIQQPVIFINPKDHWNKIYINLTSELQKHSDALDFKIFFGAVFSTQDEQAVILMDNIKLIYR